LFSDIHFAVYGILGVYEIRGEGYGDVLGEESHDGGFDPPSGPGNESLTSSSPLEGENSLEETEGSLGEEFPQTLILIDQGILPGKMYNVSKIAFHENGKGLGIPLLGKENILIFFFDVLGLSEEGGDMRDVRARTHRGPPMIR